MTTDRPSRIAFVSTYLPRHCGIATFTHDLRTAMAHAAPDIQTLVCAVDNEGLDYDGQAAFVIGQHTMADYPAAAERIARAGVDAVVIEHEYGIFGGPDGDWINLFAERLTELGVPYLVTLHTVLSHPSPGQASALGRLCRGADAVAVFTPVARTLVTSTGMATADRIFIVPHGAPTALREDWDRPHVPGPRRGAGAGVGTGTAGGVRPEVAEVLAEGAQSRIVSTFGLISPGKGLEVAVEAVANLAEEHPDLVYVIAGATHPEVAKQHGEDYRDRLTGLVAELGVQDRVRFLDFFLTDEEIAALLAATEVFLTPYHSTEQISSGALTFAVAAGCPVVSTSYRYAQDLLRTGAGNVVEPGDSAAFAEGLRALLADPERLHAAQAAAHSVGATLGWPSVARQFAGVVRDMTADRARRRALLGARTQYSPDRAHPTPSAGFVGRGWEKSQDPARAV
ncbi:glycosyltransferase involved in cell wall biosynthesis [Catenulispora sp. GP43]|uniref:glycosyltransferase n=1 Tax=Catenulispora sp. GP43 TaxID=3156263 RepID=UPI00351216F2